MSVCGVVRTTVAVGAERDDARRMVWAVVCQSSDVVRFQAGVTLHVPKRSR